MGHFGDGKVRQPTQRGVEIGWRRRWVATLGDRVELGSGSSGLTQRGISTRCKAVPPLSAASRNRTPFTWTTCFETILYLVSKHIFNKSVNTTCVRYTLMSKSVMLDQMQQQLLLLIQAEQTAAPYQTRSWLMFKSRSVRPLRNILDDREALASKAGVRCRSIPLNRIRSRGLRPVVCDCGLRHDHATD